MKRALGVLAAGLLAVTSFHAAQAADSAVAAGVSATTEAAAPAVADTTEMKAAPQQFTLKDGTTLTVDDQQMAWTTDADGKNVAATDGDKVTADGKTLTVKDGKVVAGLDAPAADAPAADAPAADAPAAATPETSTPDSEPSSSE